jgi:glycosyltransferase involved in cell wall biosynthesis
MINVLVIAAVRPQMTNFVATAQQLKQAGANVRVGCAFNTAGMAADGIAGVRQLTVNFGRLRNGRKPRRLTPAWAWLVIRNRVVRVRIRRAPIPLRTWLLARYDPWVREQAARADVLVALEQRGLYAVWRLARENQSAVAVLGLKPIQAAAEDLRAVELLAEKGRLRIRTAAEVPEAWRSALRTFARPRREWLLASAPRVVRTLRRLRAFGEAESVARSALAEDPPPDTASWLRLELTAAQLGAVAETQYRLATVVSEVLSISDAHIRADRLEAAAELAVSVAEAVFHRELHAEVPRSPLADEPETFLAPLRSSLTYRALAAPAGSLRDELTSRTAEIDPQHSIEVASRALRPVTDTSRRLLVISDGNLHFVKGILEDLEEHSQVETRRLMLRDQRSRFPRRDTTSMIVDRIAESLGRRVPPMDTADTEWLRWAETVFVDWCDNAAMWTLMHVPRDARLVVRLHSIEAFSHQPHMMDWSRVTDLIFVGAHVRDFMLRAVPTMTRAGRVHVLPNEMRLARFAQPKRADAGRTVAMVGWGQKVKDAAWAVEVLAGLRASDERWRLMLIGRDFADSQTTSGARYREMFRARITQEDVRDGLVFVPFTDNLPEVLRDAGFALSASLRESFGVGLCEGAASGAVPVVRNWPVYASYGGARAVFPADWVVSDVGEAVQRILEHGDDAIRRRSGDLACEHVVKTFDWPVVAPRYRDVLLGSPSQQRADIAATPASAHGVEDARR